MKRFLTLFLFSSFVCVSASLAHASAGDLFMKANEAYRTGDYEKAIERYAEVVKEVPQAEVYYNMGNAAFKLNRVGEAILNYERARELAPRDQDIIHNLKYVQSLLEYRVEDKRPWYLRAMTQAAGYASTKENSIVLAFLYFVLISLALIHFMVSGRFAIGRIGVFALTLFMAGILVTSFQFYEKHFQKKAVVTASKIDVRFGPSSDDRLAFSLNEGAQTAIDDELNGWYRIILISGQSGWIQKDGVEIV